MRVLVTGATGFIGPFIVQGLVDAGHTVRALEHEPGKASALPSQESAQGDMTDPERELLYGEIRRRQFAAYDEAVAQLDGIEPLARDERDTHAYHLYVVRIDAERAGGTRDEYQRRLAEENIATSIHFLPVHMLTAYRERLPDQPPLPVAEKAGSEVLSLPLSPAHSDADIADAISALRRVHDSFR